jgi:hypothetical protein
VTLEGNQEPGFDERGTTEALSMEKWDDRIHGGYGFQSRAHFMLWRTPGDDYYVHRARQGRPTIRQMLNWKLERARDGDFVLTLHQAARYLGWRYETAKKRFQEGIYSGTLIAYDTEEGIRLFASDLHRWVRTLPMVTHIRQYWNLPTAPLHPAFWLSKLFPSIWEFCCEIANAYLKLEAPPPTPQDPDAWQAVVPTGEWNHSATWESEQKIMIQRLLGLEPEPSQPRWLKEWVAAEYQKYRKGRK